MLQSRSSEFSNGRLIMEKKTTTTFKYRDRLQYKLKESKNLFKISELEDGVNFTPEFIIFKDEELIKVYSRKCDHNGGKLCKNDGKVSCPLHGWEFNPETGAYNKIQLSKKEEDFFIDGDNILIPFNQEILTLPQNDKNHDIEVTLLSHACLLFKTKDFSFATDPWIEGFAFSSGWWTSQFPPKNWVEELNKVDFIYISHNHPDHLNQFTLEKVRKDMHFIVPNFENDSVRKLLKKFGFENISSFDLTSYYQYKETDLLFAILKSGDFRDDSGFYFKYGNFSCLSTVDSNDLNFKRFPEQVTLFCSSFAGGASGFPICFNVVDEENKPKIIKRNTTAIRSTVKGQVEICNPNYFLPYAGFFSERAPRDTYVKKLNKKNTVNDYKQFLKKKVEVLDVNVNDSYLFHGQKIKDVSNVDRSCSFSEEPVKFYKTVFSGIKYDKDLIEKFFKNSCFQDGLKVYFELTNEDFSKTIEYIVVDFSKEIKVSFEIFDWESIKDLYVQNSILRHLNIKVRQDSFLWVIQKNMPFEDLSIGFQCRIDRTPDVYNVEFWNHFTNVYI